MSKPAPASARNFQKRQRGVGLDRVADQMLAFREGLLKKAEPLNDLVGGINIERSPVALG